MTANGYPDPPAVGAPTSEWEAWVDACYPYRKREFHGPRELYPTLTDMADRTLAAVAAEQWFRAQAKQRVRRQAAQPAQPELDLGEDWRG